MTPNAILRGNLDAMTDLLATEMAVNMNMARNPAKDVLWHISIMLWVTNL
jgi:hypothetical protein